MRGGCGSPKKDALGGGDDAIEMEFWECWEMGNLNLGPSFGKEVLLAACTTDRRQGSWKRQFGLGDDPTTVYFRSLR